MELLDNQFKDLKGRTWSIDVTVNTYMKLKKNYGIDITDISGKEGGWITELTKGDDMVKFMGVLCEVTNQEREQREIDLEEFFDALGGDVLVEATDALLAGVINFTPAHRRAALRKILEKLKQGQLLVGEKVEARVGEVLESVDFDQSLDQKINQLMPLPQMKSTN